MGDGYPGDLRGAALMDIPAALAAIDQAMTVAQGGPPQLAQLLDQARAALSDGAPAGPPMAPPPAAGPPPSMGAGMNAMLRGR